MGGTNPKPPQRLGKQAFLHRAAKVKNQAREVHAVYEACGLGFSLQRQLSALGIECYVVCPQKLDEQNRRVKLVKVRKVLEAQGRSLMVNHGIEPVQQMVEAARLCELGGAGTNQSHSPRLTPLIGVRRLHVERSESATQACYRTAEAS